MALLSRTVPPRSRMMRRLGLVAFLWTGGIGLLLLLAPSRQISDFVVSALIISIAVIGYDLLVGAAGQLSLANAALFGLGAYTAGILAKTHSLSSLFAIPAAIVAGAFFALVIGSVSLRLRSFYFAIITLSFAVLFEAALVVFHGTTGGSTGLAAIPGLGSGTIVHVDFTFWFIFVGTLSGLSLLIALALLWSRIGSAWNVIAEDEILAVAVGIHPFRYKLLAFVISGAFAGLAGALHAYYFQFIAPGDFTVGRLVDMLLMVFVGGAGTAWGAVLGALGIGGLTFIEGDPDITQLAKAGVLLVVLAAAPRGLAGALRWAHREVRQFLWRSQRGSRSRSPAVQRGENGETQSAPAPAGGEGRPSKTREPA